MNFMKTLSATSASEPDAAKIGHNHINVAKMVIKPLGLVEGSISQQLMIGAIAYVVATNPEVKLDGKLPIQKLKKAIAANRVILDKALNELSEDLS